MLLLGILLIIAGFVIWYLKRIFILLVICVVIGLALIIIDIIRTILRKRK